MLRGTLRSAVLTASLLAADVVLLTLYLNPGVVLAREIVPLGALFLPYLLAGTAALFLLGLAATAGWGATRLPRPVVEGLPWLTALALVALGWAAILYWRNLLAYRYSIPVEFVRALAACAVALLVAWLVLLAVAVDALLFPRHGRGFSAALVVLACASAVIVPLALRPVPAAPPHPVPLATETIQPVRRVVLVGIDGLGPELVADGVARGSLPAFARMLRRGAGGPLATFRPTEGPPIWTTIFTGRFPRDHGIKSFLTYRLAGSRTPFDLLPRGAFVGMLERAGLVTTSPVTAAARRRQALWNTLNAFGIPTGVVRVWGTYPTERIQGFMLSNYFHVLRHDPARAAGTLQPPDLLPEIEARAVDPSEVDPSMIGQFVDLSAEVPGDSVPWRRDLVERALAPDLTYERAASVLRAAYDPPFFATYYYGLDVVGHAFMRYARPERFGNVSQAEVRRYGRVVDRYAAFLAQTVGEMAQQLRPGEILLVVSGYGMEPIPAWRRVLSALGAGPEASGTHAGAPEGYLMAVGDGIRAGVSLRDASVLDVAPTLLYLMGLPVARDMEGRVLTEIVEEDFARAHPVTFIPSYESLAVTPVKGEVEENLPPLPEEGP